MLDPTRIILYLTDLVFLTTNILLLHIFLQPKKPLWFQMLAFILTAAIIYFLRLILEPILPNFALRGFITGPLYLIISFALFTDTPQAVVFVFFMIYSLTQFIYLIFMHIGQYFFAESADTFVILGLVAELFALPFINKYAAAPIKTILKLINQKNPIFIVFPFLAFFLLAFYGVYGTYSVLSFVPLVIATILIFFAYYLIALSIDQTIQQGLLIKQIALQRDHYHSLNQSIAAAKAYRRDLRQHLVILLDFLRSNNTNSAKEYLIQLCKISDETIIPTVCQNQYIDALVCHYIKFAKQNHIAFITKIELGENIAIETIDLCVILGNALENALEACFKIKADESRFIDLTIKLHKGYIIIKITNSFNGFVNQQNNIFFSTKESTEQGLGLSSINTLASKHQGRCLITMEPAIFKLSVSLKLPEAPAK